MKDEKHQRTYVEGLRDQTEQYAQNLLRENEKLRALAVAVETENVRLQEEVASAREISDEGRALRDRLETAVREKTQLLTRVDELTAELTGLRSDRAHVVEQLAGIERESRGIAEQYQTAMRQNASLANLYVSSYMLHSSLDRAEVLSGMAQIIINIVGSEDYAVLEREGEGLRVAKASGGNAATLQRAENGSGPIGALAREARVRVFETGAGADGLTAFIPLAIGDYVTGAIAIFSLLPHKPALTEADGEIFEMLSAHAATALYCASLHQQYGREVSPWASTIHP
ncbi:MAG: GAF domain-containing protein [Acidobacteriota bacterium]